jgi:hypothetical protein
MGILGRKAPLPTAVGPADANNPSTQPSGDTEKATKDLQLEDTTIGAHTHHIDPGLERQVVRKLDRHVPPLVASLCKSELNNNIASADSVILWSEHRADDRAP